jgi:hypothetical protein
LLQWIRAKRSIAQNRPFFQHTGFPGANAHIDDKYGVDVDDVYELPISCPRVKEVSHLVCSAKEDSTYDDDTLGISSYPLSIKIAEPAYIET